ncbi:MAG TPA: DNA polymerase IV [Egibacteraceae bacterium]|nr:DNA polymerase IV [Egibacteraceae bacterium]
MSAPARPAEPILHVDMDAFYASVAALRDPSLAGKPVAVGGAGGRGVVASASYEARAHGVTSAMPMSRARRLCPKLVVVAPDFSAYQRVSEALMTLLRSVTPLVEPLSLDEAFLDVGGSVRLFGSPAVIGEELRRRIRRQLGLPASVGVAANKFLAKLCSGKAKPDGLLHLPAGAELEFLHPLDIRDLWGVGQQTAARLQSAGMATVGDVLAAPLAALRKLVGDASAQQLSQLARGIDVRRVTPYDSAKAMSAEETFERDVRDSAVLRRELLRLAERVAPRLRRAGVAGRTVTVKVRRADFTTVTRSRTLATPVDQANHLHDIAIDLLAAAGADQAPVRLIGLAASGLVAAEAARQLSIGDDDRWRLLEHTADEARERFGDSAMRRAALLGDGPPGSGDAAPAADAWRQHPTPRET